MIIYAKGNIEINCGVTQIDAILIADGTVYTCGTYTGNGTVSDINEVRTRTNRLQVNGAIFSKGLELGRTYGMATGIYSKIPAEIINYDTSIILWEILNTVPCVLKQSFWISRISRGTPP